jgi:hypothetical protein
MVEESDNHGAWIFVSHSNKDVTKVRKIRDFLEREGHRPLLFYLKSLNQGDARLPQLIRDEIHARTWFVLCDSEAARASYWVQEEKRLVESMPEKIRFYVTIDLAQDLESQFDKLDELSKRATAFISYASPDRSIAERIYQALVGQDYRAFLDIASIKGNENWLDAIRKGIDEAVEQGFVLLLLSPDYLRSDICEIERNYAFRALNSDSRSNIIPIIVRDRALVTSLLPDELKPIQCRDFTDGQAGYARDAHLSAKIEELLAELKTRPVS